MGIKHEAVKASGDKGLASEWNANHVVDGDVDIDKHSWKKQVIENLASAPAGPVQGQVYYDTTLKALMFWNGTAWVEKATKTEYWTCTGAEWNTENPPSNPRIIDSDEARIISKADNVVFVKDVYLPNGAVVTGAVVYGSAGEIWTLHRKDLTSDNFADLATANTNVEDTTISNSTIDNEHYAYWFSVLLNNNEMIHSARIKYII